MKKFELIEKLRDYGITEEELVDMFVYWLDISKIEECVDDFLQDRGLKFNDKNNIVKI